MQKSNKIVKTLGYLALTLFLGAVSLATTSPSAHAQASGDEIDKSLVQEMVLGAEDAAITVIEYGSFTCPHCASFHKTVFAELKEKYIETGKIKFIHREVYFDRYGLWAGIVARCGGPEKYFGITDMVYNQQREWTGGGDASAIVANLRKMGLQAGLTNEQLDGCLSDGAKAQALVAVYEENRAKDSVRATPTFIIDGETHSNMNFADFSAILDAKLGL